MSSGRRDRTIPSCARCYRMKKKCDKKTPSCSRCTLAGAECLGIHRSDKAEVPRSAVQYLQSCLAQAANGTLSIKSHELNNTNLAPSLVQVELLQTTFSSLLCVSTAKVLQNDLGIHYYARLFYASERPPLKIPVRGVYIEEPPRMASGGVNFRPQQLSARVIPSQVATRLFDSYCKNVLPIYPCFLESDLLDRFRAFYDENVSGEEGSDVNCFIVSMILAISSLNSRNNDTRRVASLSESLQRDAVIHASFLANTTVRSLQCFTLLVQMALWLPYTANLWYLSGEMMRMAIALGLHQEIQNSPEINSTERRLRNELFWTVYRLERTVAMASGCPLALSDEHITTQIPQSTISHLPDRSLTQKQTLHRFSSQVQLSQLQSEIHGVQFFDQVLPENVKDYEDWLQKAEYSIQDWQSSLTINGEIPEWASRAADRCRLLLYRPCSRKIAPTELALRTACMVAIRTIESYWAIVQKGGLVFSFTDVFDTFQASMILIYVVGDRSTLEPGSEIEKQAHQALSYLEALFTGLATRWPAVTDTAHYVAELKNAMLRDIRSGELPEQRSADHKLLAELDFMVTQRRIYSLYHRNIDTTVLSEKARTGPSPENFSTFGEELWQEFLDNSFTLLSDDFFAHEGIVEPQPTFPWNDDNIIELTSAIELPKDTLVDIEIIMRSVPPCGYCRTRHLKCDQQYPSCGACTKSSRPCIYYDAVLQTDVLRSYVFTLYQRYLEQLRGISNPTLTLASPINQDAWYNVFLPIPAGESHTASPTLSSFTPFFGPGSCLGYFQRASSLKSASFTSPYEHQLYESTVQEPMLSKLSIPPQPISSALFHIFANSINVYYSMLQERQLSTVFESAYKPGGFLTSLDQDIFFLVLAVSSSIVKRPDAGLAYKPHLYFREAIHHPERSRPDWLSLNPLLLFQRQLLICTYILLDPTSGDIWRNLGFAIRLFFDLSHRPTEHDDMDETLLAMLFRTLYCLESQVSIAFGRPSLLIIGDKIREEMIKPVFGTLTEKISIQFYWISLLKLQVHSRLLSRLSKQNPTSSDEDTSAILKMELESWIMKFKSEVIGTFEEDSSHGATMAKLLEAWASLQYHQTAFLISQVEFTGVHNTQLHCDELSKACSVLIRHQHKSALLRLSTTPQDQAIIPVFPINWTIAHSIFSTSLNLFTRLESPIMDKTPVVAIARRSVTAMALLEGDPAMLSTGFSEILEGFWDGVGF